MLTPFLVPLALAVIFGWGVLLARAYVRSRMLPMCCRCGAWKVGNSSMLTHLDLLPLLSFLMPVRCLGCYHRYYTLRGVEPQKQRPNWQTQNRSLRYVDESSTTLSLIYAFFAPATPPPVIEMKAKLRRAVPRPAPLAATLPLPTTADEHTEQLTNLLEAIVATNALAPQNAQPVPEYRPKGRGRKSETAQAS